MSILSIKDLNIRIKNKDVITNGSLQIDAGDVLLLTGANGSGKSTIIKTLMGDLFDYGSSIKIYASQLTFDDGTKSYDLNIYPIYEGIQQKDLEAKNIENMEFVLNEIHAHMKNRCLRNLVEERSGTTPQNISTLKILDRTAMDYLLEFTQLF